MAVETRGGIPRARRIATVNATTGVNVIPPAITKHVQISNNGSNPLRVYFDVVSFNADASLTGTDGFIILPATTGFYEGDAEITPAVPITSATGSGNPQPTTNGLWLRCGTGGQTTAVEIVWYLRRG